MPRALKRSGVSALQSIPDNVLVAAEVAMIVAAVNSAQVRRTLRVHGAGMTALLGGAFFYGYELLLSKIMFPIAAE